MLTIFFKIRNNNFIVVLNGLFIVYKRGRRGQLLKVFNSRRKKKILYAELSRKECETFIFGSGLIQLLELDITVLYKTNQLNRTHKFQDRVADMVNLKQRLSEGDISLLLR